MNSKLMLALALTTLAAPALAQQPVAPRVDPPRYDTAPWWIAEPVMPVVGRVQRELRANRAEFSASFTAIAKTAPDATRQAADKVRALAQALTAYGPEAVRVEVSVSQRPIYEQYRDKDGNLIDNQRDDKIDSYEASATLQLEVRDMSQLEKVYNSVVAARPTSTRQVSFNLEPSDEVNTQLFLDAAADAKRRAGEGATALGATLGAIKLIDPSGRACETDVLLAGAPRIQYLPPATQEGVTVTGALIRGVAPTGSNLSVYTKQDLERTGPASTAAADLQLPVQPPLQTITASLCVIYALKD